MTDIVVMLRRNAADGHRKVLVQSNVYVLTEAADEIERLRAQVAAMQEVVDALIEEARRG